MTSVKSSGLSITSNVSLCSQKSPSAGILKVNPTVTSATGAVTPDLTDI